MSSLDRPVKPYEWARAIRSVLYEYTIMEDGDIFADPNEIAMQIAENIAALVDAKAQRHQEAADANDDPSCLGFMAMVLREVATSLRYPL